MGTSDIDGINYSSIARNVGKFLHRNDAYCLKTKRGAKTPNFLVKQDHGDIIVEIGGKGKGRAQFKGVTIKKKLILSHSQIIEGIKRPLFLLGFI